MTRANEIPGVLLEARPLQYEYRSARCADEDWESVCNQRAMEGWRLIRMEPLPGVITRIPSWLLYFERVAESDVG